MRGSARVLVCGVLCVLLAGGLAMADEASPAKDPSDPFDFDAHWKLGKPAKVAEAMRAMLPTAAAQGPEYRACLLTQIARTEGLEGRFDEALALLDEADALLAPEHGIGRIRSLLERGRTLNSSGKPEAATTLFESALALGKEIGADFYAIDAAHMLAISVPDKVLEWNLEGVRLAEASKHARARGWLASLSNNLGWTYFEKKDYETALGWFEKALAARREHGHDTGIARWSIAKAYRFLGRLDEALEIQRTLEKEYAGQDREDGFVFEEIAECLWAQGEQAAARPYFRKAWEKLEEIRWVAESEPARIARLKERAGLPKAADAPDGG